MRPHDDKPLAGRTFGRTNTSLWDWGTGEQHGLERQIPQTGGGQDQAFV
jgi:hypothetical protein